MTFIKLLSNYKLELRPGTLRQLFRPYYSLVHYL